MPRGPVAPSRCCTCTIARCWTAAVRVRSALRCRPASLPVPARRQSIRIMDHDASLMPRGPVSSGWLAAVLAGPSLLCVLSPIACCQNSIQTHVRPQQAAVAPCVRVPSSAKRQRPALACGGAVLLAPRGLLLLALLLSPFQDECSESGCPHPRVLGGARRGRAAAGRWLQDVTMSCCACSRAARACSAGGGRLCDVC